MSTLNNARRNALTDLQLPGSHAGLALDVLLQKQDSPDDAVALLDAIVKGCGPDAVYAAAFARWKAALQARAAVLIEAKLVSHLAIGLGNATPLEVGLSLHRTYGVPFLPGSALKGLCRRMALRATLNEAQQKALLGATDYAGGITFWDGWLSPDSTRPFTRDTVTVHHPDYYSSGGQSSFPTDFDDPIPIPFLAIKPDTKFWFALSAPSLEWSAWLAVAVQLLSAGLESEGLGAKTNAGYGRFRIEKAVLQAVVAAHSDELPADLEAAIARADTGMLGGVQARAAELSPAAQKRAAQLMQARARVIGFWKDKNKNKLSYRWIAERLEDT